MNESDRTQSRPRVLFVDDEPSVTRGLATSLRKQPWIIRTADSGAQALELMAVDPFDVVVSDERMPGLSGAEFLSQVRQHYPDTIRIVLSGHADLNAAVKAINSAEIYRFLLKPCPPGEIAAIVEEALVQRAERQRFDAWRSLQARRDPRQLREQFERALGTLWMGFQPLVAARQETLIGFEALVRTDDAEIRTPGTLLSAAERLDRSTELGRLIRCRTAERIGEAPAAALIFVNLNREHLLDPELLGPGEPLLPFAERVVLELTERHEFQAEDDVAGVLHRLRDKGFRIAVDDLGAGYSGLNSFTLVEPDVVKFDMELIRNIDRSPTKQKLISSMVELCRELGITTVAEGIETHAERDTSAGLGCDILQGFLFGAARRDFVWSGKVADAA